MSLFILIFRKNELTAHSSVANGDYVRKCCRNHPTFELTLISPTCKRAIQRMNSYVHASLKDVKSKNRKWSWICAYHRTLLTSFCVNLSCLWVLISLFTCETDKEDTQVEITQLKYGGKNQEYYQWELREKKKRQIILIAYSSSNVSSLIRKSISNHI